MEAQKSFTHISTSSLSLLVCVLVTACGGGSGGGGGAPPPVNSGGGNSAPLADAGPDQITLTSALLTLDGTDSSDPDNDSLTYAWSQTFGPSVTLDAPNSSQTGFRAPNVDSTLVFELRVDDGTTSTVDRVSIFLSNSTAEGMALDASYGTSGYALVDGDDFLIHALGIREDDVTVSAGVIEQNPGTDDAALFLTPADGTFSGYPIANRNFGSDTEGFRSVAVDQQGRAVVAGSIFLQSPGRYACLVARYDGGSLDTTFNGLGYRFINFIDSINPSSDECYAVAIQEDGKIVVGGYSVLQTGHDMALARLTADGELDDTFGDLGVVVTDLNSGSSASHEEIHRIAIEEDGTILVAVDDFEHDIGLARYSAVGELDATVGEGGIVGVNAGTTLSGNISMAIQADGKILLSRTVDSKMLVARFNRDLSLDSTFGAAGLTFSQFPQQVSSWDIAIQPDGKIVAVGGTDGTDGDFALVRFAPNGTIPFANHRTIDYAMRNDLATAIVVRSDGSVVVGGITEDGSGDYDFVLFKLDDNVPGP